MASKSSSVVPEKNRLKTDPKAKRRAPKSAWKPGQSGNPKGRPKDKQSWAEILRATGDMYPQDLIKFIGKDNDLGRSLMLLPKNVQMKYLVSARVYAALMFDPTSALWKELMERVEGKVPQPIAGAEGEPPVQVKVIEIVKQVVEEQDDSE